MNPTLRTAAALAAVIVAGAADASDWSRFRGPNGAGTAPASNLPAKVEAKDFAWKVALPGGGHSSPVIVGKRLYVTSADDKSGARHLSCLSTDDGKTLWSKDFAGATHRKHKFNSFASSTPTADDERVYLCWAVPDRLTALALDHSGKEVWRRDLGPVRSGHGFGVSPIIHGELFILANDQDDGGSLIALDRRTGADRWKLPRKSGNATYATPCVRTRADGSAEIIFTNWQHGMTAVDPVAGKVNWEISIFEPSKQERAIGSPILAGEFVLGTCGFATAQKHLVAVKPPADATGKPTEAWRVERQVPHIPTSLVLDGKAYLWSDAGIVTCVNARDGSTVWQQRVGGNFFGSPVAVGDRIVCLSNEGELVMLKAGDKFELLGRSPLGEASQSTPAVSGGALYLRTTKHVMKLAGK